MFSTELLQSERIYVLNCICNRVRSDIDSTAVLQQAMYYFNEI